MPITLEELAYRVLPRVQPGRVFAASEWRTLISAGEVLLEGSPVPISVEEVAENVEFFLAEGQSRRAWRCRVLLTMVELSSIPSLGKRFSSLTRDERRVLIATHYKGGAHLYRICAKVRFLLLLGAYGDVRAEAATGYVGTPRRARFQPAKKRASASASASLPVLEVAS